MGKIKALMETLLGKAGGVASLDENGKLTEAQRPSVEEVPGLTEALNQKVNPNLLDNGHFYEGALVDQQCGRVVKPGVTYYYLGGTTIAETTIAYHTVDTVDSSGNPTFTINGTKYWTLGANTVRGYIGEVYGVDRWIAHWTGDGVTLVEDGCVSIYRPEHAAFLAQKMDADLTGKTITFSVIAKGTFDLNIVKCTGDAWSYDSHIAKFGTTQSDAYTLVKVTGTVPDDCEKLLIEFESMAGVKSSFKAAKLELGSQQTLAHQDENGNWVLNEIPNYAEELAKCQMYYQLFSSADTRPENLADYRPTMRANPALGTININGQTMYFADANL